MGEDFAATAEGTLIFQIRLHLDPFMIHTETAFGSHPCRVVSVTYRKLRPFHGGNIIVCGSHAIGRSEASLSAGPNECSVREALVHLGGGLTLNQSKTPVLLGFSVIRCAGCVPDF